MKNKIFAICEELQKNDLKPTLERVREALGGGSYTTINPILKEWKELQASSEQPAPELPAEAIQAVSQAAGLIWKIATDKSSELTNSMKHEFEALLKEAVTEKDEALGEVASLEKTSAKLNAEIEKQAKEIQSLVLQVQKQQLGLDASEAKAVELKEEVKKLRSDLRDADNEAANLKGKLNASEAKTLELNDDVKTLRASLSKASNDAAAVNEKLNQAREKLAAAETNNSELKEETKTLRTALNSASNEVERLKDKLNTTENLAAEQKAEVKNLRAELIKTSNETARLLEKLTAKEVKPASKTTATKP